MEKAKARSGARTKYRAEDFYVDGFISELKDDIKENIVLFSPLKQAFQIAKQIETTLEGQERRARFSYKKVHSLSKFSKPKDTYERHGASPGLSPYKTTEPTGTAKNLTIYHKKALGLCFQCNEKCHAGHKCSVKGLHALDAEVDIYKDNPIIEDDSDNLEMELPDTVKKEVDQAIITLCAQQNIIEHSNLEA